MTYSEALAYLRALEPRGWRLGLERMSAFVEAAGLSDVMGAPGGPQYIHVAGTNGKGSVTAFLQSMMLSAGYRTGAFFSPYVVDPRERVWFGGEMISEEDFVRCVVTLKKVAEALEQTEFNGVTEFEFKTAVGFLEWKMKMAEWVALEVGLGGRFDATNVIVPRCSIIVSIGLDHTAILGDSLDKIAFEKSGIIKPGRPVVVGQVAPEALDVILATAKRNDAPTWRIGEQVHLCPEGDGIYRVRTPNSEVILKPSLYGAVQGHNAALAYAAMEMAGAGSGQAIADAASQAAIPGRFQVARYRDRTVVLDGAHNAPAASILRSALETYRNEKGFRSISMVTGMLSGHDAESYYGPLRDFVGTVHFAPIDFHRAIAPETLRAELAGFMNGEAHDSVREALDAAVAETGPEDLVLVTGSFYLVGDALRVLSEGS